MIDYSPTLYTQLSTLGLPVEYELFLTKDTQLPCISYQEGLNIADREGNEFGYSYVQYRIKIWARDKATLAEYSLKIDSLMRKLGFTRIGTSELWAGGVGQTQLTFRGLGREIF